MTPGAAPDMRGPSRPRPGLARLTSEDFREQQDLIGMAEAPAMIRGESIQAIPFMTPAARADIAARIFKNEGITTAKSN